MPDEAEAAYDEPPRSSERQGPTWVGCVGCFGIAVLVIATGCLMCAGMLWTLEKFSR